MKRLMLVTVIAATALPTLLLAATKSYDVVPYRNCIAQTDTWPNNRVSQYVRNTLDELTRVGVWVCDSDTHRYHVEVLDSVQQTLRIAYGDGATPAGYCGWLNIDLSPDAQPVRGRTYKVVVTRQSGQPISFAYDTTNKYRYGCLSVGGTAHDSWDLAVRIAV